MLETIVLIRHGESQKDKSNPDRKLTIKGRKQVASAAKAIASIADNGKIKIICTNTTRTTESAQIFSKIMKLNFETIQVNLRVKNIEKLKTGNTEDLTFKYFKMFDKNNLPEEVTSPILLARRFLRITLRFNNFYKTLILVGHAGGLESIANYQKVFLPSQPIKKELGYGEFIVLKKNK